MSGSFSIREIQELLEGKDMIQELHRHDFFYILILKFGNGLHEIDFTQYDIVNHTVFLMRPGQVHQLNLKAASTGYLIQFKSDFLYTHNSVSQQHLRKISQNNLYLLGPEGYQKTETILADILKEYSTKAKGYQEVLKANLSILLIELLRQRQNIPVPPTKATPYAQEKLEEFLELVESNIAKYKQVSQYTQLLNLTSYQLNAITKTLLHKTPSDILNESILLESKRQLLATSNQVSQIAYHLGYEDASYFIRFFKKHVGSSPEAFRNNSK
ncbi:helix-turn-helix transcriptional regulator [Flavobacterium paronense]|uniref:AraC family transcriptional regulator n=1 Tax=Flavobacterium paronense TaxID=1392775 RepID=UPI0025B56014|nr:helix-turn-helix transcriptional regulator [Flavobacterium paronense]MDN3677666.1 helix-turn-helix transcriptional regulator [Flavobacterium paronense]